MAGLLKPETVTSSISAASSSGAVTSDPTAFLVPAVPSVPAASSFPAVPAVPAVPSVPADSSLQDAFLLSAASSLPEASVPVSSCCAAHPDYSKIMQKNEKVIYIQTFNGHLNM